MSSGNVRVGSRMRLSDEIRDAIAREHILNGQTQPGTQLPSEAQLRELYGASRVTIRSALKSLEEAGYITTRQGQGSTVLPRPDAIVSSISQLLSWETYAHVAGETITSTDVEFLQVPADQPLADRFEVSTGTPLIKVRRTKLLGDQRVGLIEDFIPADLLPPEQLEAEFEGSVLDILLSHPEVGLEYSDCEIYAENLCVLDAAQLHVDEGTVSLILDEHVINRKGRVVNWSKAWLLQEHFRFFIRRRAQRL